MERSESTVRIHLWEWVDLLATVDLVGNENLTRLCSWNYNAATEILTLAIRDDPSLHYLYLLPNLWERRFGWLPVGTPC